MKLIKTASKNVTKKSEETFHRSDNKFFTQSENQNQGERIWL